MRTFSHPLTILAVLGSLLIAACGGPAMYPLAGTPLSVSTEGEVEVEESEGGNYLVSVKLNYLPLPARINERLTTYVVWFIREGVAPTLAGSLNFNEEERSGSMMATTPYSEFHIRVTAEETRDVASPSEYVVADQLVQE